ncbi:RING/U-box superfamily protein [Euphorbia peplus]|nr:RING/U-box superfamily protein [Euphorbia peplus]
MCFILRDLNLTTTNPDDMVLCEAFALFARLFAYVGVIALMMIVIFLITRYVTEIGNEYEIRNNDNDENNPLRQTKQTEYSYGTCSNVKDLESGFCSSSNNCTNSSDELYDGKLCVICYDEERDCFLVPCGHCATCYHCAQRIFQGENKVCPVCRRFIGKVRKLFAS